MTENPYPQLSTDPKWPVKDSQTEYETGWFNAGYDLVEQPDGTAKRYYWAELAPAVIIVPKHEGTVVFVEQYRPVVRQTCLELPAGIVETGETFEDAAARELQEETGFTVGRTELVETYWVATGVLRHRRGIVFAEDLSPGPANLDQNEFLDVSTHPTESALDIARGGHSNDATVEGLLLAEVEDWL